MKYQLTCLVCFPLLREIKLYKAVILGELHLLENLEVFTSYLSYFNHTKHIGDRAISKMPNLTSLDIYGDDEISSEAILRLSQLQELTTYKLGMSALELSKLPFLRQYH
jgi:hypothetical protein